jgi:CubicO group peptidase (beta-lactamase class C family)
MLLEQEGLLSVDDRAGKFVPGFDTYRSREITLAHLLSHTSGLRIAPIFLPFDEEQKQGETPTLRGAADKFGREGPVFAPGTTYSYSNPGYNTLGAVIEAASGRPLEAFLKSRLYDPLGMADTLNHEDPAKLARMATVYRGRRAGGKVEWTQGFTPGDAPDFPLVRASGGMISTAMDYARFLQMFLDGGAAGNGPLLNETGVRKMISPHARVSENSSYGFGWMIRADGTFGHGGSDGTEAWVDPARDLFGMVFTQSPGGVIPVEEFRKIVAAACR